MTAQNDREENKRIVRAFIEAVARRHPGNDGGSREFRRSDRGIVAALPDLRKVEQDMVELQRDWARLETVQEVVQIVLTERLLKEG